MGIVSRDGPRTCLSMALHPSLARVWGRGSEVEKRRFSSVQGIDSHFRRPLHNSMYSQVQGPRPSRGGGALLEKGGCAGGRLCFNFLGGRSCSDWRRRRRPARQIRKFWLPSFAEFFPVDALFPSFPAHFLCVRGMVRQRGLSTRQTDPPNRSRLLALADRRETEHGEANAR